MAIGIFIDNAGRVLCQNILHKKENVPVDGKEFYFMLENYQNQMHFQIHKEMLCSSDQFIDERKFDLLIYTVVTQMMYGDRYTNVIQDLRTMQSQLCHSGKKSLSTGKFENLWHFANHMFKYYGLEDENMKFLNDIKTWKLSSAEGCRGSLKFL